MWRCVVLVVVAGCLGRGTTVDGELSPEHWAYLQSHLSVPADLQTDPGPSPLATFGQELFFDAGLSGDATVSCATCHAPKSWFIDTRAANNVSLGDGKLTARNSMSLVNVGIKAGLASADAFTASGGFVPTSTMKPVHLDSPGAVADPAITGPMKSTHMDAARLIRTSTQYTADYTAVAGAAPSSDDEVVFATIERALDAYMRRLVSVNSPFDRYLAGDSTALTETEQRGFAVFVGRGGCLDCHTGPTLSDLEFHDTGVAQVGPNVPATDLGRGAITGNMDEQGGFLTGSLRQIAMTAPYMHDGSLATLADVIAFYREGGVDGGYLGTRDARVVPLDIDDDDAADLEAFLETLTGDPIPAELAEPIACDAGGGSGQICQGTCQAGPCGD
jgi:cytochrome c peroxidase